MNSFSAGNPSSSRSANSSLVDQGPLSSGSSHGNMGSAANNNNSSSNSASSSRDREIRDLYAAAVAAQQGASANQPSGSSSSSGRDRGADYSSPSRGQSSSGNANDSFAALAREYNAAIAAASAAAHHIPKC